MGPFSLVEIQACIIQVNDDTYWNYCCIISRFPDCVSFNYLLFFTNTLPSYAICKVDRDQQTNHLLVQVCVIIHRYTTVSSCR